MNVLIKVKRICNTMLTYLLPRFRYHIPKPLLCAETNVLYITAQNEERNAGIYSFDMETRILSKLYDYFDANFRAINYDNIMDENKVVIYGGIDNIYVTYE
eukprot:415428_1